MNELESKGQKWFFVALILFVLYKFWLIIRFVPAIIEFGGIGFLSPMITSKLFAIILSSLAFFLMYRGFKWPKWAFSSVVVIQAASTFYRSFRGLNSTAENANLLTSLASIILIVGLFYVVPAFLLVLSSSVDAFLQYRIDKRLGNPERFEQKLNQIGNNE